LALLALAVLIGSFRLPQITPPAAVGAQDTRGKTAWAFPQLSWGAVGIFAYVGGEVSIGSFLVNYLADSRVAGLDHAAAGNRVALYWGGAMVGRFLGSWLLTKLAPWKVLTFNALAALALLVATMAASGTVAQVAVLAIGFFNSVMFPTIFTMAIRGLGTLTAQASGILCAAIVGGAIVPLLQGFATDAWGLRWGFAVPLLCYAYIVVLGTRRFNR
jgi:FHS family L-fucose permease-like MFS transporter